MCFQLEPVVLPQHRADCVFAKRLEGTSSRRGYRLLLATHLVIRLIFVYNKKAFGWQVCERNSAGAGDFIINVMVLSIE